jgi:DNA-binding transcriptional ArsR family regulator
VIDCEVVISGPLADDCGAQDRGLTLDGSRAIVNRRMAIDQDAKLDTACCPSPEPLPQMILQGLEGPDADEALAKLAKAIGHPARVRILRMLSLREARVCSQIVDELPLAQSTVSEHLRILKDAGLVRSSQDGPRIGYCINYETLRKLKALVAII